MPFGRPAVWLAVLVALAPVLLVSAPAATVQASAATDARMTQANAVDAPLDSGETTWQGWALSFDGSEVVGDPSTASEAERTFQLRQVSEDGVVGELVREFTVDQDGQEVISTDRLAGQYIVLYRGEPVYVQDGVGYLSDPPDGTEVTATTSSWQVTRQTLEASWSDQPAYQNQIVSLSLASNRAAYTVEVSAAGLNFSQLTALFDRSDFAADYDAAAENDALRLATDGEPFPVNLTGVSPGEYLFRLQVTDTTGRAIPTLEVAQPSGPQFATVEPVTASGDRLRVNASCGTCYLIVGSQALNFLDVIALSDTDGDGRVGLLINTRYLGLSQASPDVPLGAAFTPLDDDIDVYGPSRELESGYTLQRVRNEVIPQVTENPPEPLGPGTYDLRLASTDAISIPHNRLAYDDVTDITSVRLVEPELRGMAAVAAPRGDPGQLAIGQVETDAPRDRVAVGDRLILRIDATGLFGYLAVEGSGVESVLDNADEGIDLTLHPAADPATPIRIERGDPRLIVDESNQRLYVVVDTRDLRIEPEFRPGRAYEAVLALQGVTADTYDVNRGPDFHDGYPYLEPGTERRVTAQFTLVEPTASAPEPLRVPSRRSVELAGNTTVAPGTRLRLTAVEADRQWEKTVRTTVADGGTWQATFDFSNAQADQAFTLTIERGSEELGTVEGSVVSPTPTPTTTSPSPESPTTTAPGGPTTDGPGSPTSPPSGPGTEPASPDGSSGFLPWLPGGRLVQLSGGLLLVLVAILYFGFRS